MTKQRDEIDNITGLLQREARAGNIVSFEMFGTFTDSRGVLWRAYKHLEVLGRAYAYFYSPNLKIARALYNARHYRDLAEMGRTQLQFSLK